MIRPEVCLPRKHSVRARLHHHERRTRAKSEHVHLSHCDKALLAYKGVQVSSLLMSGS